MEPLSIVVGGSKGIGLEIALTLQRRADRTVVLSRSKNNWAGDFISIDLNDQQFIDTATNAIIALNAEIKYLTFSQKNRLSPGIWRQN